MTGDEAAKPVTTVLVCVLTFLSVKPFETQEYSAVFAAAKLGVFIESSGPKQIFQGDIFCFLKPSES